ncbi:MAG: murein biosynthesis integral membrane protein MurJ [Paracoccaceae bacterium]|nr:murein biosynthesis integral membrane protein MurJ [Paracoccaceae bacterium]
MKSGRLAKNAMTVGFWTLMSRIFGFAREILILGLIGLGPLLDAFVAAFRLPNMFRRFFAEGAFNAAFVPMFSKRIEADDDPEGFGSEALNGLAFVVLVLVAAGMIFMPFFVWATASGFGGDERFDLTVGFGRIVFPYILFMSLAALFSGVLNAKGHFTAAAAAPVLLNIFVVVTMIVGYFTGGSVVQWLIWTIPVAGVAQLALVWFAAVKAGVKLRPGRPRWTPQMKHLVKVAVPAALASGVMQINLLVGQQAASQFDSAVGWLFAADRLYQLPLGVVGIAIGIVLLPDLSRRLKADDDAGAKQALSRAGEMALALTIPAAVAMIVIPIPLVSVLYERGATTQADTLAMAQAVSIYAVGLPAFVLQKILQPLYFSREDTKSPFRFAVWSMVVNAVIAVGGIPFFGWLAPAIATSVAGWTMVWQLSQGRKKMGDAAKFDKRFGHRLISITAAALVMGACLFGSAMLMAEWLVTDTIRYLALVLLLAVAAISYFGVGTLLGAFSKSELRSAFKRG